MPNVTDKVLFRGNKAKALRALPFAKKLLDVVEVRSAGAWQYSEFFRNVFPGVHVRVELNNGMRTALILAEGDIRFIVAIRFDDTIPAPSPIVTGVYLYDPKNNVFKETLRLNSGSTRDNWMISAGGDFLLDIPHIVKNTINMEVAGFSGDPWAQGVYTRGDDGEWQLAATDTENNLVPPDNLATYSGAENYFLLSGWDYHDDDGTIWSSVEIGRDMAPANDTVEFHLAYKQPEDTAWTSEIKYNVRDAGAAPATNELFYGPTSVQRTQYNEKFAYMASIKAGRLEGFGADGQFATILRVYEYVKADQTFTEVKNWGWPADDASLILLGEVEYLWQFMQDDESKWCGYVTVSHGVTAGDKTVDVHFYIAPTEDILTDSGSVDTPGGMVNATKKLTFNLDTYLGKTTTNNRAVNPIIFWHIGGGKFGFVLEETITNAGSAVYPYVVGVYDWNDNTYEIKYESVLGYRVTSADAMSEYVVLGQAVRFSGASRYPISLNVNKAAPITGKLFSAAKVIDVNGDSQTWAEFEAGLSGYLIDINRGYDKR